MCGFSYFFRSIRVRYHLGLGNVSKKVQKCKPSPEHIELHVEVVKEMKRRDEHEKIQAREMAQRSLESGQADDAIDVGKFGKRPRSSNDEIARPFQKVRKREEVDLQWARAAVSGGLPMSFFDNPEVRKSVLMTAECGQNYIRTKPGGVKEPTLSHRTFFTTNLIPKLDKLIDDKNMGKRREMTQDLTTAVFKIVAVFSDGLHGRQVGGRHNLHSDMNDRETCVFHTQCRDSY